MKLVYRNCSIQVGEPIKYLFGRRNVDEFALCVFTVSFADILAAEAVRMPLCCELPVGALNLTSSGSPAMAKSEI